MTEDWVDTTLDALAEWADGKGIEVDLHGAQILLGLVDGLPITDPGALGVPEARVVLLADLPSEVAAGAEEAGPILATFGQLVDFFTGTGRMGEEQAAVLRGELAGMEPELAERLAEAAELDAAAAGELLTRMMVDDGVDPDDEGAREDWLAAFQRLSEEEQSERAAPYVAELMSGDPEAVVPAVRLASEAELADAARDSRLLTDAVTLADWLGADRELTEAEVLTGPDTVAAVAALGLATPRADQLLDGAQPGDLDDVPELARLWDAAVAAELIEVSGGRVGPGEMLRAVKDGDREALLDTWISLFDDAVSPDVDPEDAADAEDHGGHGGHDHGGHDHHGHDHGAHDHGAHDHDHDDDVELTTDEAVRGALPGVLLALYEQEQPTTRDVLGQAVADHLTEEFDVSGRTAREWRAAGEAALDLELADLERWGAVETEASGYSLTSLGVWGVRELLMAAGYLAPVVGDLADRSAEVLLMGLAGHREDTAEEEIDLWLARREPEAAAVELVRAMVVGGPGARTLASAVLARTDPAAKPVLEGALDDAVTRPYAALWLRAHGGPSVDLTEGEVAWLFTDTVAGLLETTAPDAAMRTLLADPALDLNLSEVLEGLWRVDHPDVADVLDALGEHLPDRQLAKAARRAAFKARS